MISNHLMASIVPIIIMINLVLSTSHLDLIEYQQNNRLSSSNPIKAPPSSILIINENFLDNIKHLQSRTLFQDDEQRERERKNDQLFSSIRSGLDKWSDKQPHQRLRTKTKEQKNFFQRDGAKFTIVGQGAWQQVPKTEGALTTQASFQLNDKQLLREAGLIQKQDITEAIQQAPQKPKTNNIKLGLYIVVSFLIVACLIKSIKERCFADKARIQSHQEQSQSLSSL